MSVGLSASTFGRVGLAAHGGRFLAADDEVGLGCLLGFRDLVHQVLHFARQDDVADTDRDDRPDRVRPRGGGPLLERVRHGVLLREERVEIARADRRHAARAALRGTATARTPSETVTACRASTMRYVTAAFMRSVTLSAVMISWPAMSIVCSRRSTSTTFDAARRSRQKAYSPGGSVSTYSPSWNDTPTWLRSTVQMSSTCAACGERHDHLEVGVLEADLPGIDDFNAHFLRAGPVRVQARRQDVAETAFDPHEGALVVLQVDDFGAAGERTALDDHVELLVGEPRGALRRDVDADLAERIEAALSSTRSITSSYPCT